MQRYFGKEKQGNLFLLKEDDLYHIKTVMRMHEGDFVEVVYEKKLYVCALERQENTLVVRVQKEVMEENNPVEIALLIPLLKEQKMDLILQKATELGATKIIPYEAERSIVKLDAKKQAMKRERWQKICKEASEQSKRVDIPTVEAIHTLEDFSSLQGLKILCSTTETQKTLKSLLQTSANYDKINMIMGPEGGFSPREEKLLTQEGFLPVTLGNRILRVETVPMFLLSAIQYENME